jgi:sodium/potassium-transporting ATPase subunit beta
MVKFKTLPPNRVVMITCEAYAKNIERDPTTGLGIVNFELMRVVDETPKA